MKEKITNHKEEIILILIVTITIGIFIMEFGNFASCGDYIAQHSVFPDYFRKMFYKTSKIIPYFAPNIGGGQNIYYFSYYGLFSPLILPSYLMPFVSMNKYLMAVSIICIYASVIFLYKWLQKRFGNKISFFMAAMYLFAAPVIYQSYNQIMFIDYMVFLILALIGTDIYYEKGKSKLLIISIFLMIMTSFYFSIGGMIVIFLYELFIYFEKGSKGFFDILINQFKFIFRMLVSILMSSILLVPTAIVIAGRGTKRSSIKFLDLIIPKISSTRFLYSPYGIGLTSLIIIVLVASIFYKKLNEKILAYGILVVLVMPVFSYILNGGLYIRNKVFIPFLPILLFQIAYFIKSIQEKKLSDKVVAVSIIITFVLLISYFSKNTDYRVNILTIIDIFIMTICFTIYSKNRKIEIIIYPVIIFMVICNSVISEGSHSLINKEHYDNVNNNNISRECNDLLSNNKYGYRMEKDYFYKYNSNSADLNRIDSTNEYVTSFYSSTYNKDYYDFRNNIFNVEDSFRNYLMGGVSENPIFLKLMGVKYTVSNKNLKGRKVIKEINNKKIYDNENVCSLGYGNMNIISENEYRKLKFPYNQIALLKYSVAEEGKNLNVKNEINNKLKKINFNIPSVKNENLKIKKCKSGYNVDVKEECSAFVKIDNNDKNKKIFFLEFKVKNYNEDKDAKIIVNGVKNKLSSINHIYYNGNTTFRYAGYVNKNAKRIRITFGKGKYKIYNIKAYLYEYNDDLISSDSLRISSLWKDGRSVKGKINAKKDEMFITSIPYDYGFSIYVDGKKVNIKKVNKGFLGCNLKKGNHNIIITYKPKGLEYGEIGSAIGLLWLFAIICFEKRKCI